MPLVMSRLYNFVNDKNNGIAITASRVDAEFNQLISSMNQSLIISASAPSGPIEGQFWYDSTNKLLKEYRNAEWVIIGIVHVSSSAPTTTQSGDIWIDKSGSEIVSKIRNAANSAWLSGAFLGVNIFTGTQKWAQGANVSSASTTTLGEDGNFFIITGTVTITSITIKTAGTVICLKFNGILTLTNGSNLALAGGNFVTAAGYAITLVSDGTNWIELARSPQNAISGIIGSAVSKTISTIYQAATDGFVIGLLLTTGNGQSGSLTCVTDSSATPSTVMGYCSAMQNSQDDHTTTRASLCVPVKKGDYYQITYASQGAASSVGTQSMYFKSSGS